MQINNLWFFKEAQSPTVYVMIGHESVFVDKVGQIKGRCHEVFDVFC